MINLSVDVSNFLIVLGDDELNKSSTLQIFFIVVLT